MLSKGSNSRSISIFPIHKTSSDQSGSQQSKGTSLNSTNLADVGSVATGSPNARLNILSPRFAIRRRLTRLSLILVGSIILIISWIWFFNQFFITLLIHPSYSSSNGGLTLGNYLKSSRLSLLSSISDFYYKKTGLIPRITLRVSEIKIDEVDQSRLGNITVPTAWHDQSLRTTVSDSYNRPSWIFPPLTVKIWPELKMAGYSNGIGYDMFFKRGSGRGGPDGKTIEEIPEMELFPQKVQLGDNDPKPIDLAFGMTTTYTRASSLALLWSGWLGGQATKKTMKGVKDVDGKPLCVVVLSDYKDFVKSRYVNSKVPRRSRLIKDSNRLKFLSKESSSESDRFDWLEDCIVKDSSLDEENDGRKESSEPRYELKYFGMIRDMDQVAKLRGRRPDWYVISDDDTVWTDQRMLRKQLGRFDPSEPKLIGSFSEGLNQLKQFGTMAYGGAGIIISRSLASKILMIHEECLRDLKDVFGGDEMYSSCAARAIGNGTTKNTVVTNLISLHQMDIPGDATGFFQSGLPFLSLHHLWHSWTIPFGNKEHTTEFKESDLNLNQILLLQKSAKILGFNNFLKRSIYSSGKDLITLGYSITRFKEAIRLEDLEKIENTWSEGYQLRFMTRELIHEVEENSNGKIFEENDEDRNRKRTFYLSEIKRIDDGDDEDERFLLKNYLWIHVDKFGEKVILRFI